MIHGQSVGLYILMSIWSQVACQYFRDMAWLSDDTTCGELGIPNNLAGVVDNALSNTSVFDKLSETDITYCNDLRDI